MSKISDRLNESLNDKGISKAELARRANITRQSLNSYLVERTRPSQEVVIALANVLGVNPAWLGGYDDVPKYKSNEQREVDIDDEDVIFTYEGRKIPKEDLEMIKRFMRGKE